MGKITLVTGSMFSGKSSELLRQIKRFEQARKRCLLLKYCHDTRYSKDCVSTHDKQMMFATSCSRLEEVGDLWRRYDVIGIDEGQFFPDLMSFAEAAANAGKTVVIAALDGTFQRKPFGDVCNMLPLTEEFQKLSAVCHTCGSDAPFSKRLSADLRVELIGGEDLYVPMCRACFHEDPAAAGSVHVTVGPMFSGKSSDLLRRIRRHGHAKRKCLLIKSSQLVRNVEVTEVSPEPDVQANPAVTCDTLAELGDAWRAFDVIGIDEAQFFPDLVPFCELAANSGKVVIVAALDGTFQRKAFQSVCDLVALSESAVKLSAICGSCCGEAAYSVRHSAETSPIAIGGSDKYVAACRACFHRAQGTLAATCPPRSPSSPLQAAGGDSEGDCESTGLSSAAASGNDGSHSSKLDVADLEPVPFSLPSA